MESEQHRLASLRKLVEHRPPTIGRQFVFLDTILRPFLGQLHVLGKIVPRVRVAPIEQTNRVVEPLFIRAVRIPIRHRVFGIRHRLGPESVGHVIGHVQPGLWFEQLVNQQDRRHIRRIFLLPEHRHLHHVDQGMAQFVIENAKDVCFDKGVLRLVGHQTAGDTSNQESKRVSHTGIRAQ